MILCSLKKFVYSKYLLYRYLTGDTKQYYDGDKKSKLQMLKDHIKWELKENDFNTMYYAMGLNLTGNKSSDYIGRKEFLEIKDRVEDNLKIFYGLSSFDYDVITKDKFYSTSILEANGIPCVRNTGLILNDRILFRDGSSKSISYLNELTEPFVLKNISLEAGEGVFVCEKYGDYILINNLQKRYEEIAQSLKNSVWVLQNRIKTHEYISKINNTALNTTRIVTVLGQGKPVYLGGFQAFATDGAKTDSWSSNSIYVGINVENSSLRQYGFTNLSDERAGLIYKHPNSRVEFADYHLPFLQDSVTLCCRAHSIFYNNFVIGWDVAITDNGPLIVEANEKPGMNVVQCVSGGLRKKILGFADYYLKM